MDKLIETKQCKKKKKNIKLYPISHQQAAAQTHTKGSWSKIHSKGKRTIVWKISDRIVDIQTENI